MSESLRTRETPSRLRSTELQREAIPPSLLKTQFPGPCCGSALPPRLLLRMSSCRRGASVSFTGGPGRCRRPHWGLSSPPVLLHLQIARAVAWFWVHSSPSWYLECVPSFTSYPASNWPLSSPFFHAHLVVLHTSGLQYLNTMIPNTPPAQNIPLDLSPFFLHRGAVRLPINHCQFSHSVTTCAPSPCSLHWFPLLNSKISYVTCRAQCKT